MGKNKERQEHEYVPPTPEELDFTQSYYGMGGKSIRLSALIEKQRQGVELGIRPQTPRGGLSDGQQEGWDKKVWQPWLEKSSTGRRLRPDRLHTNPNLPESTQRTTLRRDRVTLPSDLEE